MYYILAVTSPQKNSDGFMPFSMSLKWNETQIAVC